MKEKIDILANNTVEIKKILKENFPTATFRIKTKNFAGGKSITIYTDLIRLIDYNKKRDLELKMQGEGLDNEEYKKLQRIERTITWNKLAEQNIKTLLKDFWSVDYDEYTGEILGGGNCYLFVERLKV